MWTPGVNRLQLRGKVFELRVSNRTIWMLAGGCTEIGVIRQRAPCANERSERPCTRSSAIVIVHDTPLLLAEVSLDRFRFLGPDVMQAS